MFRLFVLVVLIVHTTSIVSVTADSISSFKNPWAEHNAKMMAKSTNTINKETVGASCTVDTDCNAANVETCCSGFCVQLSGRACCGYE